MGSWTGSSERERAERVSREWAERDREERELADRGERTSRRRPRAELSNEPLSLVSKPTENDASSSNTRFYLETHSPVVDAPSIGPKMAEKLAKFGIITVNDFLNRPAQWIADKLADSKLNAETLRTWQTQSSLMCQVPGLRGHDAQLLVGVRDHESRSDSKLLTRGPVGGCRPVRREPRRPAHVAIRECSGPRRGAGLDQLGQ